MKCTRGVEKMMRNFILILVLTIAAGGLALNHCEVCLGAQTVLAAEGKIDAIDTFKSTVTVKSLALYPTITYREIPLFVASNSKIMKHGSVLSIFDLTMGAPVAVEYIKESGAPNTLVNMTITK
ncbi:MAG: hypothetical protein KJ584_05290 [Candidatus Omnitrophica bacterium]|nr:hypothetical protein [Candidatus Omnitrophota bacterium]MBU0895993.1 hypothetical protein [Candidatus Omnitrophota bacterium]